MEFNLEQAKRERAMEYRIFIRSPKGWELWRTAPAFDHDAPINEKPYISQFGRDNYLIILGERTQ